MSNVPINHPTVYQLPFPFFVNEPCTFQNFYAAPNQVVFACLKQLVHQPSLTHSVYLWGQSGVGCSHLLKACVASAQKIALKAVYLSLKDVLLNYHTTEVIELVKSCDMLCLDDVDRIVGCVEWEETLFQVYNDLVERHIPMVFAAHAVPYHLQCTLPDLISRFNSGLLFKVHPLDDNQKVSALRLRAHLRGVKLTESIAELLVTRLHRNPRVLMDALNQLDLFSLAKKRRLTTSFVKAVLKL